MILIKQKNGVDCGLAVAAMLARTTYDRAADVDPNPDSATGLSVEDFRWSLIGLTGQEWRASKTSYLKPLHCANLPNSPCAVLIRDPAKTFGHWVAFDGQEVLDPEKTTPLPVANYDRRDWLVIRIVTARHARPAAA